jgi:hypothetical protein
MFECIECKCEGGACMLPDDAESGGPSKCDGVGAEEPGA